MFKKLLALGLIFIGLAKLEAQQITLQAEDKLITQLLSQIEKEYAVRFAYNIQRLKGKRASIDAQNRTIGPVLNEILNPLGLVFDDMGDGYFAIHKAQSVFLKVRIYDQLSLENLPYATIRLKGTGLGTVSDTKGEAFFVVDNPINAEIELSFLGYEPVTMPINPSNSTQDIAIGLEPITTSLGDVEVKEYLNRGIVSTDMASSFRILPQEMEILPGLVERDPLLSAQIIAGVNSNGENAASLNIRGSSPENTFIYWNNIPVYQAGHYFGTISNFIPSSIGQIDIFKNYIPIEYSGASAGILKMESRAGLDGLTKYEASLNMTHADFYGKVPFKKDKGVIMFSARRSYNDLISTPTFDAFSDKLFKNNPVPNSQGGTTPADQLNIDLQFSDVNLKWVYESNNRTSWSASLFRSANALDASQQATSSGSSVNQNYDIESIGLNAGLEYRVNDNLSSKISLSYSQYDMAYNFLSQRTDDDDDSDDDQQNRTNNLNNIELRLSNSLRLKSDQILRFGYQFNYLDISNRLNITSLLEEDSEQLNDSKGYGQSIFGEYHWDITKNWELIAGTRFNHFSTLSRFKISPQLRTNYRVSGPLVLKASFGVYDQYVRAVEETELTISSAIEQHWLLADSKQNVPLTTNIQTVLGFLYEQNGWLVDLDIYQKDLKGLLARNQGFDVNNEAGFAQGSEVLKGFDLTIRKRWKHHRAWISYNFQDSKAKFSSLTASTFPSSLNVKHQLSISNTFDLGAFQFSLGYTYKSGLPFSSISSVTLEQSIVQEEEDDEDEEDDVQIQEFYKLNYSNHNTFRLKNYHRVDISAWYKFGTGNFNGEIGLSLINAFNRSNLFNKAYSVTLENNQPGWSDRNRALLGFTPNLSIRINF